MPCGSGCSGSTTAPARLWDRGVVRGESGSDPHRRRGSNAQRSRPISHPLPRRAGDPLGRESRLGRSSADRDHAVLRWNATGTEWGVPIRRSTVTVKLPRELDDVRWTTTPGPGPMVPRTRTSPSGGFDCANGRLRDRLLRPGEGITVEVTMPGDAVCAAGWTRQARLVAGRQLPLRHLPRDAGRLPGRLVLPRPGSSRPRDDRRQLRAARWARTGRGRHPDRRAGRPARYLRRDHRPGRPRVPHDQGDHVEVLVLIRRGLSLHAAQGSWRPQAVREEALRQALRRQGERPHERPGDEVLPGDRAGQERPLPGPEPGRLLRRQSEDRPSDVPRPRPACAGRRAWAVRPASVLG